MTLKPFGRIFCQQFVRQCSPFTSGADSTKKSITPAVKPGVGRLCSFRAWATCNNCEKHGFCSLPQYTKGECPVCCLYAEAQAQKIYVFAIWDGGTLQPSANSPLSHDSLLASFRHPSFAQLLLSQIRMGGSF